MPVLKAERYSGLAFEINEPMQVDLTDEVLSRTQKRRPTSNLPERHTRLEAGTTFRENDSAASVHGARDDFGSRKDAGVA